MGIGIREYIKKLNVRHATARSQGVQMEQRMDMLLGKDTSFIANEAYKSARTNITFALGAMGKGCKKIIITSASPGEGKTVNCLNLAITFAQTNARVLVIDADLRRPRVHRSLKVENQEGLSDVLCGLAELDKAVQHSEEYNLDFITAGQIPPNPVELLSSSEMENLLNTLGERYDYIFIDTPPVTMVTDATALAKFTSGTVVIIRQNYTIHETLQYAQENLKFSDVKILGYILNDIDTSSYKSKYSRYGYKFHYGYRKYGYGRYGYKNSYGYNYGYGYGYGYGKKPKKEEKPAAKKQK